jgi:transcriptional regulator with XRE-family HTH domain
MVEMEDSGLVAQVGRNIAARRKQLDMRQDQLAEAIGVEPESISRFERAAHAPALKTLEKLAIALSMPAEELLKVEQPLPPTEAAILQSYFAPLSPENRSFALKSLKDLARHLASQQRSAEI